MQSRFYDGLMRVSAQDNIVRMIFVNISEGQDGKRQIGNSDEIVLTLNGFEQMCESINELREKLLEKNNG